MKVLIECNDDGIFADRSAAYIKRYKLKTVTRYSLEDSAEYVAVWFA
jgi:hypothetical protein